MKTRFLAYFRRSEDIGSEEYERLNLLRKTNMSEVWLARRKRDKLITVTKIARVDRSRHEKANQEAIQNEANWLGKFRDQARIVQIYHSAETNLKGKPRFIAMEYLDGGTIEDLLLQPKRWGWLLNPVSLLKRRSPSLPNEEQVGQLEQRLVRGRLTVEQSLQIIGLTAEGLALLHSKGVVHRDIKPDNIMFRQRPLRGRPMTDDNLVLIDLGIAAAKDRPAGAAVSRGWSDPICIAAREQRKKIVSETGFDIYSAGQVLRYMLTGEKPSQLTTETEPMAAFSPQTLRFSRRVSQAQRESTTAELSQLIKRCLSANMASRPSAKELNQQATQILQKISPRSPFPRVHRLVPLAMALIVTLFALAFAQSSGHLSFPSSIAQPLTDVHHGLVQVAEAGQSWIAAASSVSTPVAPGVTPASSPPPTSTAVSNDTAAPVTVAGTFTGTVPVVTANTPVADTTVLATTPRSATSTPLPPTVPPPTDTATAPPTPTATIAPAVTRRPTSTPTPQPIATEPPPASNAPGGNSGRVEIEVIKDENSHLCNTEEPDTWHNEVVLVWENRSPAGILPAQFHFEVVVWMDNGDPLLESQAYTIHGQEDLIQLNAIRISLSRRPSTMVATLKSLIGKSALPADTIYKWGIVLVANSSNQRLQLLTPASGCKFILHSDLLK